MLDCAGFASVYGDAGKKSPYNKLSLRTSAYLFNKYLPIVDSFVLLTEQMNEVVNPKGKPYTVMEGIASDLYDYKALEPTQHPRVVTYSGGIQKNTESLRCWMQFG